MSPDNMAAKAASSKEDNNNSSSGSRKNSSARPAAAAQEQAMKCPRCDSPNTKFCYYNNYSLTQPRHFCKTCRRYWTKGGALRNVPIGGGCRKNKKMKSSSRLFEGGDNSKDSSTSSDHNIGGLKFFHGLTPAMDFQLGGLGFPRHNPYAYNNQFSSLGEISNSCPAISSTPTGFNLDPSPNSNSLMGFNFPFSSGIQQEMGSTNNLSSSIESLSSINQDLHWRLQQQRLAMLYGPAAGEDQQIQKPQVQPILFQNLEINNSKAAEASDGVVVVDNSRDEERETGGNIATEWFFGNSYGGVTPTPANSTGNGGGGNENVSSWNGMLAWTNLNQYSPLP